MVDGIVLGFGLVLLLVAVIMTAVYLVNEKGSLLDPITISWAGHALFIGGGMILVATTRPERGRDDVLLSCALMMLIGTFTYTVGLYMGKQKALARMIPTPRPTLSDAQIWLMWMVSISSFAFSFAMLQVAPFVAPALVNPFKGIIDGAMGAAVLLSVMVIFGYRGRMGTKVVMVVTLVAVSSLIFFWSWSRRPLVGVLVAAGAYFYRARIMHRGMHTRLLFLGSLMIGAVILLLFLGATRGRRIVGVGTEAAIFSMENYVDFAGGITINYEVAEFALQQIPSSHPHLFGSGFVPAFTFFIPRAIWPSKPVGTGWYLTTIWYHTNNPDNNLALTIIGEWYANFSFPGVIFGMLLIGMLVRAANTWLRRESNNQTLWPAWLLVLPDFATEWRGDFTSMTVQAFVRIAVFLILAWFAGKFAPSGVPSMSPLQRPTGPPTGRPVPANVARAIRATRRPPVCGP